MRDTHRGRTKLVTELANLFQRIVRLEHGGASAPRPQTSDAADDLADLSETASDVFWEVDDKAVYTYVSPRVLDMLGYSPEEVLGRSRFDLMPREESERLSRTFAESASSRTPIESIRYTALKKDGQFVVLQTSAVPIFDQEGGFTGYRGIDRDVSEQKETREALRRERENLINILNATEDGVCIIDSAYGMTYTNLALDREFGAHSNRACYEYFRGRTTPCPECGHGAVMEGETVRGEWYCDRNGRTYDIITTPVKNALGEVSKLSMLRDMTERKRTEEALRESEAKYRAIFENLHDTYYRTDLEDNLLMASPSGERIFGFVVDEAVGRNLRDFYVDLADRDRVLKLLSEQGYIRDFEAPLRRKDGSIIWVSSNAQIWHDRDGNVGGVEGITRDITERKTAEEALRQSEQKYRQVVELAHEGVWKFDDSGITTFVNSRMAEMLECSTEEMLGAAVVEFVEESNQKQFRVCVERAKLGARNVRELGLVRRKSHTRARVRFSIGPVQGEDGTYQGALALVSDITEQRELEDRILETNERAQRQIGQDLHDGLGQELTGIAYMSKVLEHKLAERSVPEAADAEKIASYIDKAISHARDMVSVLNPVRLESGGLVQALQQMAANVSHTYGIPCSFECCEDVQISDAATATHVFRIAQEAVNNAMKHAAPGRISIRVVLEEGLATLSVQDDGAGFREGDGHDAGMGLKTMQHRSMMVGGTFFVESSGNGGTIVTCSFPYRGATIVGPR